MSCNFGKPRGLCTARDHEDANGHPTNLHHDSNWRRIDQHLVCWRWGLETTTAEYLAGYARQNVQLPEFNLDIVLHAAGATETWGRRKLKTKKQPETPEENDDIKL